MAMDHQAFNQRLIEALDRVDVTVWDEFYTDDVVQVYPQSGEIVRGRANARAIMENYPGGLQDSRIASESLSVAATEQKWVMTPVFTLVSVEGTGDVGTATMTMKYADGSEWWVVSVYRVRQGKIAHQTVFFAPAFDPPAWRSHWVELEDRSAKRPGKQPPPPA